MFSLARKMLLPSMLSNYGERKRGVKRRVVDELPVCEVRQTR